MAVLSNLSLDFDAISAEIENYMKSNQEIGTALFPSDTANLLKEILAGLQTHTNFRIETWVNNAYMPTAELKSAIYNIATTLGSPPRRKVGSSMLVRLTVDTALSQNVIIPKNSVFSSRNLFWYNKEDLIFNSGQTQLDFYVYQGEYTTETFVSTGTNFQEFVLAEGSFNIDEDSISVFISPDTWIKEKKSLIFYKGSVTNTAYKETTNAEGTVSISFGNGTFGAIPAVNNNIVVSYYKTAGLSSNSNTIGDSVQLITVVTLNDLSQFSPTISSVSTATGGDNEESPETVKFTSPRNFASNDRAVRRSDYEGFLKKYPGVAAVKAWGEYEETNRIGKNDPSVRNQIYFSAIKNNTEIKDNSAGTIQTGVSIYNFTISDLNILRGSLNVNIGSGKLKYYDIGGYLVSNDVSINSLTGGTPNTNSQDPSNPITNAFDNNSGTYYSSLAAPTLLNPIIMTYDFGSGNAIDFGSIRFQGAGLSDYNSRATPKQINIWGSNLASPNINNDSDWTIIKGFTTLPELLSQQYTDWIILNTSPSTYRHLRIKIFDRYGNSNTVKLGSIELQKNANLSSVNYTTSSVNLKVDLANVSVGDSIDYSYIVYDYSDLEITNIKAYMDPYIFMNCNLNYINPLIKSIDISAEVYYKESVLDPNTLQSQLSNSLYDLFSLSQNSIGRDVKHSDIINKVLSNTNVDWCNLLSPSTNLIVRENEVLQINSVSLTLYKTLRTS